MKKAVISWTFFLLLFLNESHCDTKQIPFIIGGTDANTGQFPYQASLRTNSGKHFCGGSIISSRWILTAAHCLKGATVSYAMVGTNSLSSGGVRYDAEWSVSHFLYNPLTLKNDIGLVKTAKNIEFNDNVNVISLPASDVADGTPLIASGWGKTVAGATTIPDILKFVPLKTISNTECSKKFSGRTVIIHGSNLCTEPISGFGTCQGDSGGPLARDGYVYGITSFGISCGTAEYPSVFTRVTSHRFWTKWKMTFH